MYKGCFCVATVVCQSSALRSSLEACQLLQQSSHTEKLGGLIYAALC